MQAIPGFVALNCIIDGNGQDIIERGQQSGVTDIRHCSLTNLTHVFGGTQSVEFDFILRFFNNVVDNYTSFITTLSDIMFPGGQCLETGGNTFSNKSGVADLVAFADKSFAASANLPFDSAFNPSREEDLSYTARTWLDPNDMQPTGNPTKSKNVGIYDSIDGFVRQAMSGNMPGAYQLANNIEPTGGGGRSGTFNNPFN